MTADLALDGGFLTVAAAWRPTPVEPGGEQVIRQAAAADERSADMTAEHRRAVITPARVAATQVPRGAAGAAPTASPCSSRRTAWSPASLKRQG